MSCSACQKRKQQTGRIVPVKPTNRSAERSNDRSAITQGNALRQQLRFTGR